jgi:predicted ATPase
MEQPELHLHPAHQAKLADALLRALKSDKAIRRASPLFIVETHSEALINRLGELIEMGDLKAEDVQVIVFSADQERDARTSVETSEFNRDGSLRNWPYGFFNY